MNSPRRCYVQYRWLVATTSSMHHPHTCRPMEISTQHLHQRTPRRPKATTVGTHQHRRSRINRHPTLSLCTTVPHRIPVSEDRCHSNNQCSSLVIPTPIPKEALDGLLLNNSLEDIQVPDIQDKGIPVHNLDKDIQVHSLDKGILVHNLGIIQEVLINSHSLEVLRWVLTLDSIQVEAVDPLQQQVVQK